MRKCVALAALFLFVSVFDPMPAVQAASLRGWIEEVPRAPRKLTYKVWDFFFGNRKKAAITCCAFALGARLWDPSTDEFPFTGHVATLVKDAEQTGVDVVNCVLPSVNGLKPENAEGLCGFYLQECADMKTSNYVYPDEASREHAMRDCLLNNVTMVQKVCKQILMGGEYAWKAPTCMLSSVTPGRKTLENIVVTPYRVADGIRSSYLWAAENGIPLSATAARQLLSWARVLGWDSMSFLVNRVRGIYGFSKNVIEYVLDWLSRHPRIATILAMGGMLFIPDPKPVEKEANEQSKK